MRGQLNGGRLRLAVAPGTVTTPGAGIKACPLTADFEPVQGGALAAAPAYDCAGEVVAKPSPNGADYTIQAGSLAAAGRLAVALLPLSATDRIVLAAPSTDTLQLSPAPGSAGGTAPAGTAGGGAATDAGRGSAKDRPSRPATLTRVRRARPGPPDCRPASQRAASGSRA